LLVTDVISKNIRIFGEITDELLKKLMFTNMMSAQVDKA
jgi:hypothetical protein